jgi:hypothetical protein
LQLEQFGWPEGHQHQEWKQVPVSLNVARMPWKSNKSNTLMLKDPDIELGLLNHSLPITQEDESLQSTLPIATSGLEEERRPFHDVIAETLELLSRHLRAYRWAFPDFILQGRSYEEEMTWFFCWLKVENGDLLMIKPRY